MLVSVPYILMERSEFDFKQENIDRTVELHMERSEFDFKQEYIDRTGELQGNN